VKNIDKGLASMFLYPGEVQKLLGIGATKFYELVKLNSFPRPRKVGTLSTPMFLRHELIAWAENLPNDDKYIDNGEEK
jgi:predicted DNA-binding transcriptional regulator AlpA